jgi:uncharacterized protein (TIGR02453 family)
MERAPTTKAHLSPELFTFLRELSANNNRDWFEANKSAYERAVRDPLLRFVEEFGPALHKISRHLVADARANGGSISRIYRDLRFSKDRRPYKTDMALHFWHRKTRPGSQAPSYYLRLAPGECLAGGGMWQPDSATLKKVRAAIAAQPKAWQSVHDAGLLIKGEMLRRLPPGYPSEHRFAADLMRKSFLISQPFTEREVCSAAFLKDYAALCERMVPFARFLTKAVGLQW